MKKQMAQPTTPTQVSKLSKPAAPKPKPCVYPEGLSHFASLLAGVSSSESGQPSARAVALSLGDVAASSGTAICNKGCRKPDPPTRDKTRRQRGSVGGSQ